jgi:2-oxoglutarate/2-oxoacid ferredoxin oxidoreductase subunit alpha
MERLLIKWRTARSLVPPPQIKTPDSDHRVGLVFFGTTAHAAYEAINRLAAEGLQLNSLRLRAFPFQDEVAEFINRHEKIMVIEQNRDGQLRSMLMTEEHLPPAKLQSILNFDGLPITADFITASIKTLLVAPGATPDGDKS